MATDIVKWDTMPMTRKGMSTQTEKVEKAISPKSTILVTAMTTVTSPLLTAQTSAMTEIATGQTSSKTSVATRVTASSLTLPPLVTHRSDRPSMRDRSVVTTGARLASRHHNNSLATQFSTAHLTAPSHRLNAHLSCHPTAHRLIHASHLVDKSANKRATPTTNVSHPGAAAATTAPA